MNWRRDIVTAGRLLALAIIVLGGVLAFWNATDISEVRRGGSYPALRGFIRDVLQYVWYGGLILIVTEIVGAMGGDDLDLGPRIRWTVPELTAVLGATILVTGTLLTLWDTRELNKPSFSGSVNYFFLHGISYIWQGGLLFALAALADYLGWRDERPEEEEVSLVATEP